MCDDRLSLEVVVRLFLIVRTQIRRFFVLFLFWDRLVEVFVLVFRLGLMICVEVRLDVVENDVSLLKN